MSEHPIEGLMDVTLEKIKSMVDSNTIIGNPINMPDGTLILPVSKVSFGFASGGSDFPSKTSKQLFGGGGGAGVSISPIAFLVVRGNSVRMLQLADTSNSVDRAIGMMPEMVDKVADLFGKNKKAIATDLDNTLWGGVVGDDGPEALAMGSETPAGMAHTALQQYLKDLSGAGVLLNVCSKNEDDAARAGLRQPAATLREEDFVCFCANWQPKDANLAAMAKQLNLLPESFVFLDDNPAERALVRQSLPGVAVPELAGPESYVRTLDRAGYFEAVGLSADDKKRAQMYRENALRSAASASFSNYGEYLRSLAMRAEIGPFRPGQLGRITQLINKTNQFNLTTRRYSQADIEALAQDPEHVTLYGKLCDKFGDNGVVSVVVGRIDGNARDELHMELWLMSCRVLKRNMEFAMMDALVDRARALGIKKLVGYYYPTAKNAMVKEFYALQGFSKVSEDEAGNTVWEFPIRDDYEKKQNVIEVNT